MIHVESMVINKLHWYLIHFLIYICLFNDSVVGGPDINSATRKMSDLTVVLHLSLHTCS